MHYRTATLSPLLDTLNTRDSLLKSRLTEKISTLNHEVLDRLEQQPGFTQFVQHAFDQAFATLPATIDLNKVFIKVGADTSSSSTTVPVPPAELSDAGELMPLLPTLMDTVAARIVNNTPAHYANRSVSFHRSLNTGDEADPVQGLGADAFERFLNTLASNLGAQFKEHFDRYWNDPVSATDSRTCKEWVAEKRFDIMKAEVELLKADGVLDTSSELLLMQVSRYPDALSRSTLSGYRPCAYGLAIKDKLSTDIPLYGAFVLTSRDQDAARVQPEGDRPPVQVRDITPQTHVGGVLLFLPGSGFEAFDSLANLDLALHGRLNSPSEFNSLLDLMEEKDRATGLAFHQQQVANDQFRYVERLESIFSYATDSLYQQAQAQFTWMVAQYQRQRADMDSAQLPTSLDRVTDLARGFDASGVLAARPKKQIQLQLKQFLKGATLADKQAWEVAVRDYSDQLLELGVPEGLPSLMQYSDPQTVLAYSNEQLRRVMEADHGLTVDPDDIIVHTKTYVTRLTGSYVVGGKPHPSEPGARIFDSRKRTLTQLALENVEWLDLNFINFSRLTDKEQAPWPALSVTQVKNLVRTLNIGDSYEQFLKARLVTCEAAQADRQRYKAIMALQMRVDAIEAKIANDFLPDRLDRGYNWVTSVLAGPTDDDKRNKVEGHRIIVSHLKLRGETIRGVLVFSTASQSVASLVVYTPQGNGGRVFHEFADESAMHRDFINHSAWRDYLVERTGLSARARIRSVLKGGARAAVIALTRIADDFLEEAYTFEASAVINDANAQSTSTRETNVDSTTTLVTAALDLAMMFMPVKIMLPIGLARSILSVINAVEAAQVGDSATAAQFIVRAFGELVGAAIDGAVGASSARITTALRPNTCGLNPKLALPGKPEGVVALAGWEAHHLYVRDVVKPGAFEAPQHFLLENNRWYSIRRDNDTQVWRLRDPRRAPSAYKGDPLFRNRQGVWEIRSPGANGVGLGLLGGAPPATAAERALMDLFPYLDQQQAYRVFDAFVFPRGRELEFQMTLVHQLRTSLALPLEYQQYLLATPRQFDLLVRGQRLSSTLTPSPVEPIAGPSRSIQAPDSGRVSQPGEHRVLDWGQDLDLSTLEPVHGRSVVWRSTAAQPGVGATEYIPFGEQYYSVLPGGSETAGAVIVPNHRRYSTFTQFEDILHHHLHDQPRLAEYSASLSRWLIGLVPFQRPLVRYIERCFPTFTRQSARYIAEALFNSANPNGLSTHGYSRLLNTIRDWRTWSTRPATTLGDPLLLLSRQEIIPNYNAWSLSPSQGRFNLLELSTSRVPGNLAAQAFQGQNDVTTRALMSTLLRNSGYEVFEVAARDHLLLRRTGQPTVYWLSLRRTPSSTLASRSYRAPGPQRNSFEGLPPLLWLMATQAHISGHFVRLIGVLQISRRTGVVTPFIFRP